MNPQNMQPESQQTPKRKIHGCVIAILVMLGLGIAGVGGCVLLTGAAVSNIEKEKQAKIKALDTARPSDLVPYGDLANKFNLMSEHTDIQRENAEKEIAGQVVQWTLTVYEVKKNSSGYRVQTDTKTSVGTFIDIFPKNDGERSEIEALKEGDAISFRGYIDGVSLRHIEISPAVLIAREDMERSEADEAKKENANAAKERQTKLNALDNATISELLPYTDTHRAKGAIDQVVEWNLIVSDISRSDLGYKITTKPKSYREFSTIIDISPRGIEDQPKLEGVKIGDTISFRGYVGYPYDSGAMNISPAVLTSESKHLSPVARELKAIESATPSKQLSYDELAEHFFADKGRTKTELQTETTVRKFKGKIVQWTLKFKNLQHLSYGYMVEAWQQRNIAGAFTTHIYLFPRSDEERSIIELLKEGDLLTFRGYVEEITNEKFQVSPAILILGKDGSRAIQTARQEPVTPAMVEQKQENAANSTTADVSEARIQLDRDRLALERERLELDRQKLEMDRNTLNAASPGKDPNSKVLEKRLDATAISTWDLARVRYEINTIYARRGVEFPDREIQAWANKQSWYQRVPGRNASGAENLFTDAERFNIELLAARRAAASGKEQLNQPVEGESMQDSEKASEAKPGSPERINIMDAMRVPVSKRAKKEVVFTGDVLVSGNWAKFTGHINSKDGKPFAKEVADELEMDFLAILQKVDGKWNMGYFGWSGDVGTLIEAREKLPAVPQSLVPRIQN